MTSPSLLTSQTAGSGPDSLILAVSGTAYQNVMPNFTVSVDGQPVGGVFTVTAQHGQAIDGITLNGSWGAGPHDVQVHYLNDDFAQTPLWATDPASAMALGDRNLFLDGAVYDGHQISNATQAIYNAVAGATWGGFSIPSAAQQAHGGTGAFSALDQAKALDPNFNSDTYLASLGLTAQDFADYQQQSAEANVAAGNGAERTIVPPVVSDNGVDFNGKHFTIQHVEDFGHPEWIHNLWGNSNIGADGVTSSSGNGTNFSGAMQPVGSASAGEGYGLYLLAVQFDVQGDHSGPYACLWPATDGWPGPEIDLLEFLPGTSTGYATLHWNDGGHDAYKSTVFNGVDFNHQTHFVWADWEDGSLTFGVDDKSFVTLTEHVPKDFAHGGENALPGIGSKNEGAVNSASMFGLVYATPDANGTSIGQIIGATTDHPL